MDRFDLRIEVPAVTLDDLAAPTASEASAAVAARVARARQVQRDRFAAVPGVRVNADAEGDLLDAIATLEPRGGDAARARSPPSSA